MKFSSSKEVNQIVKRLISQGWNYWRGGKHGRLGHPSGHPTLTVPGSPSDHRAALNFIRDLRHAIDGVGRQLYQNH